MSLRFSVSAASTALAISTCPGRISNDGCATARVPPGRKNWRSPPRVLAEGAAGGPEEPTFIANVQYRQRRLYIFRARTLDDIESAADTLHSLLPGSHRSAPGQSKSGCRLSSARGHLLRADLRECHDPAR